MAAEPLSSLFATHVLTTPYNSLTPLAITSTKTFILDTLGVGIAGSSAAGTCSIQSTLSLHESSGTSSLWGHSTSTSAPTAALLNAYQTHCQEFDCVHEQAVLHPLATILPAVLSYASSPNTPPISGRDLILTVALGVNVSCGLGISSRSAMRFFRPATAGAFGAVAALGKVMGLRHEQLVSAFGLQYAQTSGTLQPHVEGSAALPLQVGLNARASLLSCELARSGMEGPEGALDGEYGFLRLVEGPEVADWSECMEVIRPKEGRERRWLISEVSHKPYPAGRATHAGVEGLLVLMGGGGEGGNGETVRKEDVEKVKITAPALPTRLCARPDLPDPSPNYARLCTAFVGAKVLKHGYLDLSHYRGEELTDKETHDLATKFEMVQDAQEDPNVLMPVTVEMVLNDGSERKWTCEEMLASPSRRLTREQHLAKFKRCWEFSKDKLATEKRERLIKLVDNLENVADVREVLECVSASVNGKL